MTSEYNAAQRALHKLKQNVSDFDLLPSTQDSAVVEAAIAQDLQTLSKRISEYRLLGRQEVNERKRTMMLDRATSMADEHEQLKRRTDKIKQRRSGQQTYESERSELFQRDNGARVQMDTAIVMEADFYARSEQQLDGYIAQGMASLQNLREQRGLLQSAHRRILNADATLGLSRGVIKLINRRTTQDKLILGGGMAVTCFFIYLIIHFLG